MNILEMEEAKNLPEARRARIVMVTSQTDRDNVIASKMAHCNGYIVKPFTKASIYQTLLKVFTNYAEAFFGTTVSE